MWIDDAIYLTTGVVLLSLVALVVVLVRNRGTLAPQLVLVGLLVIGPVGTSGRTEETQRDRGRDDRR